MAKSLSNILPKRSGEEARVDEIRGQKKQKVPKKGSGSLINSLFPIVKNDFLLNSRNAADESKSYICEVSEKTKII